MGGTATWDGEDLRVYRGPEHKPFPVSDAAPDRIRPAPDETRDLSLSADFWLPPFVGPLPKGADLDEYETTGFNWNEVGQPGCAEGLALWRYRAVISALKFYGRAPASNARPGIGCEDGASRVRQA